VVNAVRSPFAWALLGLVIERPSYGWELAHRFGRIYGDTLVLSSPKQVYRSIETLRAHALIEEVAEDPAEMHARHPRPRYRATPEGIGAFEEWLLAQATEASQRQRTLVQHLTLLDPETALEVIERYKHACLEESAGLEVASPAAGAPATADEFAERLSNEHDRLAFQARLTWIEYARQQLADAREAEEEAR
jgi:DNA-binding PadR family transcriptional regulator